MFARHIYLARRALRLTQSQLAARLGVTVQCVSNWECDRSRPWPEQELRILERLKQVERGAFAVPSSPARLFKQPVIDRI
jgi:DNA-binding transcriptional regulator YiaG